MDQTNKAQYLKRIDLLIDKLEPKGGQGVSPIVYEEVYQQLLNLLPNVYGSQSVQIQELREHFNESAGVSHSQNLTRRLRVLKGLLAATKADLENGYIKNPFFQVTGEVLGDFISLAKIQLDANFKDVAAVLACAAFEDALKRKAQSLNLGTEGKDLSQIVNALKSQGVLTGAQVPIVSGYVRLRNNAMHADWEKIRAPEVSSLIAFTEQFLLSNFS